MKPLDLLAAIAVPVLWGAGFALAKGTFDEFPPIFLMGLRFTLAAAILIWFVKPMWDRAGRMALIAFVGGTLAYGLQFTGLEGVDVSTASLVVQLEVAFAALFAGLFFKDRLAPTQWIAMAFAFAGVALIAGEPKIRGDPVPFLMLLAGGVAWAGGQTLVKALGAEGGLRTIAWFAAFTGPQMLLASLLVEEGQWRAARDASWQGWTAVLYLAAAMTATGYALWFRLVSRYPMSRIVPFLMLVPVTGIVGGVAFLGEDLTGRVAAGGAIVMASVAFIHMRRPPVRRPEEGCPEIVASRPLRRLFRALR